MDLTAPTDQQPSLEQVRVQFEQWRRSGGRRRAIPDSLWDAAASLYPTVSLSRISKTLGLDYTKLKHYVHGQVPDTSLPAQTAFIELGSAACACTVEMQHRNGSMIVQNINGSDLMKLARLFWSRS